MPEPKEISFERLVDWVEGRLSEEEARAVAEQVATAGDETRADVEWLRAFAAVSEDAVLAPPPPELREELVRRFEAFAQDRRRPGLLQRFVATLSFDSGLQPAAAGVRSAGAQERQRQLVYTTELADIALNVRTRPGVGHFDILGQIFPNAEDEAPEGFGVQLLSNAKEFGMTVSDELGEFAFESVPPGEYELVVSSARAELLISGIELRA